MPAAAKMKKQILSASEIQDLKQEKSEVESTLKALDGEGFGKGTPAEMIDKGRLRAEADRLGQAIVNGTPGRISGVAKDNLVKEMKGLEASISDGMPTRDEMRKPSDHPGIIRRNQEWEKRNRSNIERWKQGQRQLQPGDPTASNIERLRRA